MAGKCEGRVTLVTGGGAGIGRGISQRFAREGAIVVVADLDERAATETVAAIHSSGGQASAIAADVAEEEEVRRMIEEVVRLHGRLDIAANNAGITDENRPFHELSKAQWDRMIAVNLTGVFLCMKHEIRQMRSQDPIGETRGAIVNTSSGAAIVPAPGKPHYAAAKHGVVGLTRNAAHEYLRQGIRVNAVLPGITNTAMTTHWFTDEQALESLPRGRGGEPMEIAEAVLWLASDEAGWVNGQSLVVDGGGVFH